MLPLSHPMPGRLPVGHGASSGGPSSEAYRGPETAAMRSQSRRRVQALTGWVHSNHVEKIVAHALPLVSSRGGPGPPKRSPPRYGRWLRALTGARHDTERAACTHRRAKSFLVSTTSECESTRPDRHGLPLVSGQFDVYWRHSSLGIAGGTHVCDAFCCLRGNKHVLRGVAACGSRCAVRAASKPFAGIPDGKRDGRGCAS